MFAARLHLAGSVITRSVASRPWPLKLVPTTTSTSSCAHLPRHALRLQPYTTFVPTPMQIEQPSQSIFSTCKSWFEDAIWQMSSTVKKRRSKMNKHKLKKRRKLERRKTK